MKRHFDFLAHLARNLTVAGMHTPASVAQTKKVALSDSYDD